MDQSAGCRSESELRANSVAIIGLAVRAPGVDNLFDFWSAMVAGRDLLGRRTSERGGRRFVEVDNRVPHADAFDYRFLNYTQAEAKMTDPQHRILSEMAWECFEDAGIDITSCTRNVGVFVATGFSQHYLQLLLRESVMANPALALSAAYGCFPEHAATRLSYKLDLRGPSFAVSAACSSSLVAVAQAFDSLRLGNCDLAIAGGMTVSRRHGYEYIEGAVHSPDGVCRPYDFRSNGTVFGQGGATLLLKRLKDAERDGDRIYAYIPAVALNNDGKSKAGYTAPSSRGQAEGLRRLLAGLPKGGASVRYIEGHGTATVIGDPLEVAALTDAFGPIARERRSIVLGSVKSNVGHLGVAAGAVGLLKAALSLHMGMVPPTVHFRQPNPLLRLEDGPFWVNDTATPLRAAEEASVAAVVCALGIGGTNAYVALCGEGRSHKMVVRCEEGRTFPVPISGATEVAADAQVSKLEAHLSRARVSSNADVAFTYQVGRASLPVRRAVLLHPDSSLEVLGPPPHPGSKSPAVVFLFGGQGGGFGQGCQALLTGNSAVADGFERCAKYFAREHGVNCDWREFLEAEVPQSTRTFQAALFAFEYSLAGFLNSAGIAPQIVIGHSVGELAALASAGMLSPTQAMDLIAERGRLMEASGPGAMLAVPMAPAQWKDLGVDTVDLAAINGPAAIVLAGSTRDIDDVEARLSASGFSCRKLRTRHGFHSRMQAAGADEFAGIASGMEFSKPSCRVLSTVNGQFVTKDMLSSREYWSLSLSGAVLFYPAIVQICRLFQTMLVEIAPAATLSNLIRLAASAGGVDGVPVIAPVVRAEHMFDRNDVLRIAGHAYNYGCPVQWERFSNLAGASRTSTPTYAWQREYVGWDEEEPGTERKLVVRATASSGTDADIPTLEKVQSLFARILGVPNVLPDANFFSIGGDSIAALALLQEISTAFPPGLRLSEFMSAPCAGAVFESLTTINRALAG